MQVLRFWGVLILISGTLVCASCAQKAGSGIDYRDGPASLFLTWDDDPTSTMTIQWLRQGTPMPRADGKPGEDDVAPLYDIPRVDGITLDGDLADWDDRGLRVDLMNVERGDRPVPYDLDARMRLGWNDRGLVVAVSVRDDMPWESDDDKKPWDGDSVEAFVANSVGGSASYQYAVVPGIDPWYPVFRELLIDHRKTRKPGVISAWSQARQTPDGCVIEMLLPWENLGIAPSVGKEFAFQLHVNDRDNDRMQRLMWYPHSGADRNTLYMQRIRLAENASPVVRATARGELDRVNQEIRVQVRAVKEMVERDIEVRDGDRILDDARLKHYLGRAGADLVLPAPTDGKRHGTLRVTCDGGELCGVEFSKEAWSNPPPAGELWYAPTGSDDWEWVPTTSTHLEDSDLFVVRAELTGLQPNTLYRFIPTPACRELTFRTAPAKLERPLTFAAGGDPRYRLRTLEVSAQAARRDPLFALIGGDFGLGDGEKPYEMLKFLVTWRQSMVAPDGRLIPLVAGIGNHEVIGGYNRTRADAAQFTSLFPAFREHGYATLDFGDYMSLILLDTEHTEAIAGAQTRWLEDALKKREDVPHVFASYHVPAYASNRDPNEPASTAIRKNWLPLLEKYGVRTVFESHDHTYKRTKPIKGVLPSDDGITFVGDGCWGQVPRPVRKPSETWYLLKSESTMNFLKVTLEGRRRKFQAIDEHGAIIDRFEQEAAAPKAKRKASEGSMKAWDRPWD